MSLLERLRENSTFDSEGQFTLDGARAKKKMSRFQLTEPERFLLLMLQAAMALGATEIELELGRELQVRFDGTALEREPLAQLDEFLLSSSGHPQGQAYHLLAVALNALTQLKAERIELASSKGFAFWREATEWRPGKATRGRNRLRVKLKKALALENMVNEHLRYCPARVTVNQTRLTSLAPPAGLRVSVSPNLDPGLDLVRYGVVVGTTRVESPIPITGVVVDDDLRLNASFSAVVEDEVLERCRNRALKAAHREVEKLAANPAANLDFLRQLVGRVELKALDVCPLFPKHGGGLVSRAQLQQQLQSLGHVPICRRRFEVHLELIVVDARQARVAHALEACFTKEQLVDAEADFLAQALRQQNRRRWQNSARPATLPPGVYLARAPFEFDDTRGEIGIDLHREQASVDVLYQGNLLCSPEVSELPPGCVAVLDFPELEVSADWSSAGGRPYRRALGHLEKEAARLFELATQQAREADDFPQARDYILTRLQRCRDRANVPEAYLDARVLETVEGRRVSLNELAPPIRLAEPGPPLSARLPEGLDPGLVLPSEKSIRKLMNKFFGHENVVDFGEQMQQLRRLSQGLDNPQKPQFEERFHFQRQLDHPPFRGCLALQFEASKSEVRLLRQGVPLGSRSLRHPGTNFLAILECPDFTPNQNWSGIDDDEVWEQARQFLLNEAEAEEKRLVGLGRLEPSFRLQLLLARPELAQLAWDQPLLPTCAGEPVTLAQIEKELRQHSEVLCGDQVEHPQRFVLKNLNQKTHKFLDGLFNNLVVTGAEALVEKLRLDEEFLERPREAVKAATPYWVVAHFPEPAVGELAIGPQTGRELRCYQQSRLVHSSEYYLPEHVWAALEHPQMQLDERRRRVKNLNELEGFIYATLGQALLLLADSRPQGQPLDVLLELMCVNKLPSEIRGQLSEKPLIRCYGEGRHSLAKLRQRCQGMGRVPYVTSGTSGPLPTDWALELEAENRGAVKRLLGKSLQCFDKQVAQAARRQQLLADLPDRPPRHFYSAEVEHELFRASFFVPRKQPPYPLIARDRRGQTVGMLSWKGPRLFGFISSAFTWDEQTVELSISREMKKAMRQAVMDFYSGWLEHLETEPVHLGKAQRELLMATLLKVRRSVASSSDNPTARLARRLWQLPLFECNDGRLASAQALMACAEQQGGLAYVEKKGRLKHDNLLPVLAEGSVALELFTEMLGRRSLKQLQHPSLAEMQLFDSEQLRGKLDAAVAWGLGAFKSEAAKPEERKASQLDPEKRFLKRFSQELELLVPRRVRRLAGEQFSPLAFSSWPLGPAFYYSKIAAGFRLNRLNPNIRWLLQNYPSRPDALVALVAHWMCRVNHALEEVTDHHERELLEKLATRVRQTLNA